MRSSVHPLSHPSGTVGEIFPRAACLFGLDRRHVDRAPAVRPQMASRQAGLMEANKSCERSSTRVLRHEVVDRIVAGKKHQCCSCAFGKAEMAIFDKKRRGQSHWQRL